MVRNLPILLLLINVAWLLAGSLAAQDTFSKTVRPFLARNCFACHGDKLKTADLNLESFRDAAGAAQAPAVWEKVFDKLRTGQMPPPGRPAPAAEEVKAALMWIENNAFRLETNGTPNPGRVTAHRLNRVEYNNTIRDLLALDFRPADDFPRDDEGYGFDNIGDVLSLSPVLMEKYLAAAEQIALKAIAVHQPLRPTVERYMAEKLNQVGSIRTKHFFPADAEYELKAGLGGIRPDGAALLKLAVCLDDEQIRIFDVNPARNQLRTFDLRVAIKAGEHELGLSFLDDTFRPEDNPIAARDRYLAIDFIEVRGPFNPAPPAPTEIDKRIFTCGHGSGSHIPACGRKILSDLARRAYRRPVTDKEIGRLEHFVQLAEQGGDSFERGIQLGLKAILVSPHFLFRIERDPVDPGAVHPINDYELASRLSYFLWSSMPDEELFRCAEKASLRKPGVLESQLKRMLLDPKSSALVENFAGQWLQVRNLESVKPDPDRFPDFDEELRSAMRAETRIFFETIMREDRSVLDFIDARFTFLNERLARHYGIPGVVGPEFRRVSLKGNQRSGILTQASVLTVSSYPTRTSPVLRGKWLLENFLGAPPPPPPPGVANVNEEAIGSLASLRQQLEKHRSDQSCAVCHARMDALGFGLENYDAIGAWRNRDGRFPVDSSGVLPGGKSFRGPGQLKEILKKDKEAFIQCLTEKMLTYALGRGLERYDVPAVSAISRRVTESDGRFSRLVLEIVNSWPFQMRRGDGGKL
jgi:hypothetical protein